MSEQQRWSLMGAVGVIFTQVGGYLLWGMPGVLIMSGLAMQLGAIHSCLWLMKPRLPYARIEKFAEARDE